MSSAAMPVDAGREYARPLVPAGVLAESAAARFEAVCFKTFADVSAEWAARAYVEHLSPEGFDPSHRFWLLGRTTIGSPSENIAYHRGAGPPRNDPHNPMWTGIRRGAANRRFRSPRRCSRPPSA